MAWRGVVQELEAASRATCSSICSLMGWALTNNYLSANACHCPGKMVSNMEPYGHIQLEASFMCSHISLHTWYTHHVLSHATRYLALSVVTYDTTQDNTTSYMIVAQLIFPDLLYTQVQKNYKLTSHFLCNNKAVPKSFLCITNKMLCRLTEDSNRS